MASGYIPFSNTANGLQTRIAWSTVDDSANNRTAVTVWMEAYKTNGYRTYGTYIGDCNINGTWYVAGGVQDECTTSDWTQQGNQVTQYVAHGADGSKTVTVGARGYYSGSSDWGSMQTGTGSVTLTNYVRLPGAPGTPTITAIGTTTATATWTAATGPNIDAYWIQVATDSGFTNLVKNASVGNVLTYGITGLTPGKPYWVRVRAHNSDGYGAYSAAATFTTLAGVYVSDGANWKPAEIYISDGVAWQLATLLVSDGTTWKAPA